MHTDLTAIFLLRTAGGVLGETSGQVAVIARTNAGLFTELVKICDDSGQRVRIGFAGVIYKTLSTEFVAALIVCYPFI